MIRPAQVGGKSMRTALSGFFQSYVTIVRATSATDEYGAEELTWAPVVSLTELPALVAGGDVSVRMKKQEFRTSQNIHEMLYRRVLIAGYHPDIELEDRVRVDDKDWAIVSTVVDVTSTWTELLCEDINAGNI
jgi:hypothetical protein